MKRLIELTLLTLFSTILASAQSGQTALNFERPRDRALMEQQVLRAGREYNELMKRLKSGRSYAELGQSGDLAALDRLLADEYLYASRDGEISNKAEDLESYKTIQNKIESAEILEQKVRILGNTTAVETGLIRYQGVNKGKPFDITKRYTTTWVWRDSRWQIVADHTSAQPPSYKLAEQQVLKLNLEYSEMIQRGDAAAIERILADDYILTDENGKVFSKADDLATYKNRPIKIESVKTLGQKVRVVGEAVVIANATINFKGTKNGKGFDVTEQCTTIWAWRDGRWQIISDHISFVKQ